MKQGFYWVKTITNYRDAYGMEEDTTPTIGFCKIDEGHLSSWQIIGSDEVYYTYDKKRKMEHSETCIIPIKQIREV